MRISTDRNQYFLLESPKKFSLPLNLKTGRKTDRLWCSHTLRVRGQCATEGWNIVLQPRRLEALLSREQEKKINAGFFNRTADEREQQG